MREMSLMIYMPFSIILFLILLILLPLLWFSLAVDAVQIASTKLGFSPSFGLVLLSLVIVGSTINIPLYQVRSQRKLRDEFVDLFQRQFLGFPIHKVQRSTVIALNVGGGMIPMLLALYQFTQANPLLILLVIVIVTIVSYYAAHVVPGIGIQMNPLLSPITAAASSMLIANSHAPSIAFAGGVLGTLIGADLLHLKHIQAMSSGVLSIGGAGVFDGIVLCGLFAVLLS
jgi:uncharacterized membrane protein